MRSRHGSGNGTAGPPRTGRAGVRLAAAGAGALALIVATVAAARDYAPAFRPERLKGPPPGPANEVMVLGTTHLSELPDTVAEPLFGPLLDRMAAWRPEAIATENVSGLQCDALRRYPYRYEKETLTYCPDPSVAGRALGLDVPAANAAAERMLLDWPAVPAPAQRRRLAVLFLAAGEPNSALVQWLRLPVAERRGGDGLNDALVAELERRRARRNESAWIAAPLAARLGHERVWSVDDHSADSPTPATQEKAYEAAIRRAWDNPALTRRMATIKRHTDAISADGGVLALYRWYNSPAAARAAYESDFGAAFVEPSPQRFGRQYLGYWETRNLRMVANIRDILSRRPGTRLLAVVGASHKGYYEAYLNQMHDVRLVDPLPLLGTRAP